MHGVHSNRAGWTILPALIFLLITVVLDVHALSMMSIHIGFVLELVMLVASQPVPIRYL